MNKGMSREIGLMIKWGAEDAAPFPGAVEEEFVVPLMVIGTD